MGDSILERYRRMYDNDKLNESNEMPQEVYGDMNEEDYEEYSKELKKLRTDPTDSRNKYMEAMKNITFNEQQFIDKGLIKESPVKEVKVIRAYCPNCGKELISKMPPMFNPFTQEKQCIHQCECGSNFNLEYVYPRIAYFDEDGNEIMAYGL